MTEEQLNEKYIFLEEYGSGYMVADYRDGDNTLYCGCDLAWRRQPITNNPFIDKTSAIRTIASTIG